MSLPCPKCRVKILQRSFRFVLEVGFSRVYMGHTFRNPLKHPKFAPWVDEFERWFHPLKVRLTSVLKKPIGFLILFGEWIFGEDSHFDEHIFQIGWFNHQLVGVIHHKTHGCFESRNRGPRPQVFDHNLQGADEKLTWAFNNCPEKSLGRSFTRASGCCCVGVVANSLEL